MKVSLSPDDDQRRPYHRDRLSLLEENPRTPVVGGPVPQAGHRWANVIVRSLICVVVFAGVGCSRGQTDPRGQTEEQSKAQLEKLLAAYPPTPPDTPEQFREKEARVEKTLPQVHALLEEAKADPKKVDKVVELSMSLLTLVPGHRAAKVAYCRAQLAAFFAKEATDPYNRTIAINSAALEIDRLRENFDDLSEDEVQLCQEVYFNQARLESYFPYTQTAPELFKVAIDKLMSSGFRDAKRLKTEPRFESLFTDPKFAPILEAAIAQIEGSAADDQSK